MNPASLDVALFFKVFRFGGIDIGAILNTKEGIR